MNTTHHKFIALLLGAGLLGLSGIASAAVVGSKHDLGSNSATTVNKVSDTDETCVFCHTPHKGTNGTAPLWNKALTSSASFNAYSSTTMEGTVNWSSSTSMACLSCHDGTQAMDNIINASGSGNYDADGDVANDSLGLGYTWSLENTATADGVLDASAITNLGTELGDDHPIAIPYGGGGITVASPTAATTDPDFRQSLTTGGPNNVRTASIGGVQKWWVDADNDAKMDTSEIRLYTANNQPQVECASCHDPHGVGTVATFLRVANTSSAVCTACHVK